MKISNSKKELARIISENGGWQEHCEWAVQDKSGEFGESSVILFDGKDKPIIEAGMSEWMCAQGYESDSTFGKHVCDADKLVKNWHQTILSSEEYFHLYPAPDADGWIEWKGGECPVGDDSIVDVMFCNGRVGIGLSPLPAGGVGRESWRLINGRSDIIAYRPHNPEQAKPEFCESVMRSIPEPSDKPTIEQLAADYRNAKDCAERKQKEADEAKADAEAKLDELVAAGKALNLAISVTEKEPELVITDWRDWMIGDLVELINRQGGSAKVGEVGEISKAIGNGDFYVDFPSQSGYSVEHSDIKFIRRP